MSFGNAIGGLGDWEIVSVLEIAQSLNRQIADNCPEYTDHNGNRTVCDRDDSLFFSRMAIDNGRYLRYTVVQFSQR